MELGGYYMMEFNRLAAYERLAAGALAEGRTPDFMIHAENARLKRSMGLVDTNNRFFQRDYETKKSMGGGNPVFELSGALSREGYCNTGYEEHAAYIRYAAQDPTIDKIGLKINSGGGGVDGVIEVAEAINYAKKQGKEVVSWGGFIASAAYFIASQSNKVFLDAQKVSGVGSVGVLFVHVDEREALAKAGKVVTIHRAEGSEGKALINSVEEVPETALKEELKLLSTLRSEFIGYVRRGRKGKLMGSSYEDARMFNGANALKEGLIDGQSSLFEFLDYIKK